MQTYIKYASAVPNFARFVTLVLVFFSLFGVSACQLGRFIFYNFADIKDYKKFPARPLTSAGEKFIFKNSISPNIPKTVGRQQNGLELDAFLEKHKTVAFVVIQNDEIQYEKYFSGYDQASIVPSFSMAKSVCSILIGCAIDDKLIQSVNEPITNYIPELKKNGFEKVSILHVLQMTSGLDFKESYVNPFGHAASFYYGRKLRKQIAKLQLKAKPGTQFEYVSGNTQLLGLILERALKNKTVTQYLQEKIWTPLGMEYDASWSIDKRKNGLEKTFCCLNARARDFAKIGRLYLNKGVWNGKQIVSKSWVEASTAVDTREGSAKHYQYQWWFPSQNGDFMAVGILGQYIYVNPSKNLVVVRLGKKEGGANWWSFFVDLAKMY